MTCCGDGFEEYAGRYVPASALGGFGQLVLYQSSIHDYTGNLTDAPVTPSGLPVDRVLLPADPRPRI